MSAPTLRNFVLGFIQAYARPKSLYDKIARGENYKTWLCVLVYCSVYVIGSLWLYFKGFTPFEPPWIKLPEEIYYLVQAFTIIDLLCYT